MGSEMFAYASFIDAPNVIAMDFVSDRYPSLNLVAENAPAFDDRYPYRIGNEAGIDGYYQIEESTGDEAFIPLAPEEIGDQQLIVQEPESPKKSAEPVLVYFALHVCEDGQTQELIGEYRLDATIDPGC